MTMTGFIAVNTSTNCPASGCTYNPLAIAASEFRSGVTLIIAGVVVIPTVKIESYKEDRASP